MSFYHTRFISFLSALKCFKDASASLAVRAPAHPKRIDALQRLVAAYRKVGDFQSALTEAKNGVATGEKVYGASGVGMAGKIFLTHTLRLLKF